MADFSIANHDSADSRVARAALLLPLVLTACLDAAHAQTPPDKTTPVVSSPPGTSAGPATPVSRIAFHIPAQPVETALTAFGQQSGLTIAFETKDGRGQQAPAISGLYTPEEALRKILQATDLRAEYLDSRTIVVHLANASSNAGAKPLPDAQREAYLRLTQAEETFNTGSAGTQTALAQTTAATNDQARTADKTEAGALEIGEIIVTASRISRAGFDQPTPTMVIGETELRQGARPTLQQVLNDQPQFRQTVAPQATVGNLVTGVASVDLRGLGVARTLTLLDGRRFAGENNLNFIPTGLVDRVEVVTGGASAAWGSGAVAGVVNVLLKKDLEGLTLGAQSGISSRGDGKRNGVDLAFGKGFADGRGHVIFGAEYVDDKGVPDRNSRRNLGSAGIVRVDPLSTTDLSTALVRDVNYGYQSAGGLITTGVLAGQTFAQDGTLRPFNAGTMVGAGSFTSQMIGGADGIGLYDDIVAVTPFERLNLYGRASYDLDKATVWVDVIYGRAASDGKFVPDFLIPPLPMSASNPFLSASIRDQLAAAGETGFTLGRVFNDIFQMGFDGVRVDKEFAAGIDGELGRGFSYNAYYTHGEVDNDLAVTNARLAANFAKAINAVSSGGQIVCAVNADADPTNDDPACRPLDPFGRFNASPEAIDYVTGTQSSRTVTKLDAVGVKVQGDLLNLWAGPLTAATGVEARWESQATSRSAQTASGVFAIPLFTSDLEGRFNVKEWFGEIAAPLVDVKGFKFDLNGAARYSDYSTSGGIWSWKLGGTARLFNDFLLRATRSRDIRSPGVADLYSVRRANVGPLVDQDTAGRASIPGYNPNPSTVTSYSGGNPDLRPEISRTLAIGGSYSPEFIPGFSVSADYYEIDIRGAIATLSASNLTLACALGSSAACSQVIRNPTTQTVETVFSNAQNISVFETSGVDLELSYRMAMSRISENLRGSLSIRALATYVDHFIIDTGITRVDTAGDVGDASSIAGLPQWRGTLSVAYQGDTIGIDARVRYVDGGQYSHLLTTLVNNDIASRTYVDLGMQARVSDWFTVFGNVNNVFDVAPPISTVGNPHYDVMGTYFVLGVRAQF